MRDEQQEGIKSDSKNKTKKRKLLCVFSTVILPVDIQPDLTATPSLLLVIY